MWTEVIYGDGIMNSKALITGLIGLALASIAAHAATVADWPEYLFGAKHQSFTPDNSITPSNVGNLHRVWHFKPPPSTMAGQPPPQMFATPTVVGGRVYVGFNNGVFYALNLATGKVVWQRFLGFVPKRTCPARGFTSTATVKPNPLTGVLTVYVNAGDGYLYALHAQDGSTIWRSLVAQNSTDVNGYYNWTSPAVSNGKVYVGLSSECDNPFTR